MPITLHNQMNQRKFHSQARIGVTSKRRKKWTGRSYS